MLPAARSRPGAAAFQPPRSVAEISRRLESRRSRSRAAIRCNELTTLPFKTDKLLADPARLAAMRRAALAMGRPHAARTIVRTLLEDDLPPGGTKP